MTSRLLAAVIEKYFPRILGNHSGSIDELLNTTKRLNNVKINVIFPTQIKPQPISKAGVLVNLYCNYQKDMMIPELVKSHYFSGLYTWLFLSRNNTEKVEAILDSAYVLPNSNVYALIDDVALYEVYRMTVSRPLIVGKIWEFDNIDETEFHDFWNQLPTITKKRKDLGGVYLNCSTIISQPQFFLGWNDLTVKHIDTWAKFTYPLMMNLASDLNYKNNMLQIDNYGVELANGTFDGMCGRLQRGEDEFGITSMFMRKDRWNALDFSAETLALRSSIMFRQPPKSAVTNIFILPFEVDVWLTLIGTLSIITLISILMRWVMNSRDELLIQIPSAETVTFIFGAICQQGTHICPNLPSMRFVMFSALVASLFVFTSYSAKIVAILQTPSKAIRTLSDLTDSPLQMGVQETTYKKVYFTESNDRVTQKLYKTKILPKGDSAYLSVVDGIARMKTNLFAFQVEASSGYDVISKTYTEREKCGLAEIEAFKLPMVALPIKKRSGYKELFASRLRWHREVGLIDRTRRIWIAQKPQCDDGGSGFVSVGISDCFPAIKVFLLGVPLSLIVFLFELVSKMFKRNAIRIHKRRLKFWNKI